MPCSAPRNLSQIFALPFGNNGNLNKVNGNLYWKIVKADKHAKNHAVLRGGASPEKVGWKSDRIDGQKVYLTIFMSFLLENGYRIPEESGVDKWGGHVHPSPPRGAALGCSFLENGLFYVKIY